MQLFVGNACVSVVLILDDVWAASLFWVYLSRDLLEEHIFGRLGKASVGFFMWQDPTRTCTLVIATCAMFENV